MKKKLISRFIEECLTLNAKIIARDEYNTITLQSGIVNGCKLMLKSVGIDIIIAHQDRMINKFTIEDKLYLYDITNRRFIEKDI